MKLKELWEKSKLYWKRFREFLDVKHDEYPLDFISVGSMIVGIPKKDIYV